jgi:HEAT repeat protein
MSALISYRDPEIISFNLFFSSLHTKTINIACYQSPLKREIGMAADTGDSLDIKFIDLNTRKRKIQGYIELLKSPHLDTRWKAAENLGVFGDQTAVQPLIEALNDPFVDVAWLAAKSLGSIGDSRAVDPLLRALNSKEPWLRAGAAIGLGKLKEKKAVEPLIALLGDSKKLVRKHAAWALGFIGDDRALKPLEKAAREDPDEKVKTAAEVAIRMIRMKSEVSEGEELPVTSE